MAFISTGSGSGHICSPARSAAAPTASRAWSDVDITPAMRSPRATMHAPVSVATSTMRSGSSSLARAMPSPSTRRPSASVLRTSTVRPPYMVSTSEGRIAVPDGMFSARHAYAVTRICGFVRAIATIAPSTAAAPLMSHFIVIMPSAGLMERPPESNVMPLPTSARCGPPRLARPGEYAMRTSRGGSTEPWPTPIMPP